MSADGLSFRRTLPRRERSPWAMAVLLLLVGVAVLSRPLWLAQPPKGVMIEVVGAVPHPGMHILLRPTLAGAVDAAGGDASGLSQELLPEGSRVEVTGAGVRVLPPSDPLLVALPVDLNQADARALIAIPGVGEAVAAAILADRAKRGIFYTVDDLLRVRGVGPKALVGLRPFVTVGEVGPRPAPVPLDLNQASAAELESLPGIGPVTAARIVVDRDARGPYGSLQQLTRVRGIGPKTVARLAERVVVK